jgi:hypothetical protein
MPPSSDRRRYAPATERNREPILNILKAILPPHATILEIASGTGQHAAFFASQLAPRHWLPSDPSLDARDSIQSWRAATGLENLYAPLNLDMTQPNWVKEVRDWQATATSPDARISAIVNINMIHISPWSACVGLLAGAEKLLIQGDMLYFYGPFKRDGNHTAPSNEAFDISLRSQNASWGIRDVDDVAMLANEHQFHLSEIVPMPANNFSVTFQHQ